VKLLQIRGIAASCTILSYTTLSYTTISSTNSSNCKLQNCKTASRARQFHNCNGNNERLPGIAINIAINQNVRFMCSTNCKKLNLSTALFSNPIHLTPPQPHIPISVRNSRRGLRISYLWVIWVCFRCRCYCCCCCCSLSLHRLKAFIITNCVNIGTPSKSLCIFVSPSSMDSFALRLSIVDMWVGVAAAIVAINEIHIYKTKLSFQYNEILYVLRLYARS